MPPQSHRHGTAQPNAISDFIDRYGWRAYALPVMALLTVITLFRSGGGHNRADAVAPHHTSAKASVPTSRSVAPTTVAPTKNAPSTVAAKAPVKTVTVAPDPSRPGKQSNEQAQGSAASTPCPHNTAAREVVVSIAAQHAWMCARSALVYSSAVTTGKTAGNHATPTGRFTVQGNVTDTTLTGADYAVHVDYWIEFNGDIGFHDASWQTMAFGSTKYKTEGSRGCVHMPLPTVAWLHKWVQIGKTRVVVTKS